MDGHRNQQLRNGIPRAVRACIVAVLLSAGCAADPDVQVDGNQPAAPASTAANSDSSSDAADAPADEQQVPQDTLAGAAWTAADTDVERPVEDAALLRAVRTARHDGFDRIVLDFGDDDVPGYRISWIDSPVRQCGSGNEVPLAGEGWLSMTVQPANAHTEAGAPTVEDREQSPGLPAIIELKMICDFEAMVEVVAGVTAPAEYRAFVLSSPGRLVVDIRHPDQ